MWLCSGRRDGKAQINGAECQGPSAELRGPQEHRWPPVSLDLKAGTHFMLTGIAAPELKYYSTPTLVS